MCKVTQEVFGQILKSFVCHAMEFACFPVSEVDDELP